MPSTIIKRSIVVGGRKTSVSLENEFWEGLREIAARLETSLSNLVPEIQTKYENHNLSSAIRLFVLNHFRSG